MLFLRKKMKSLGVAGNTRKYDLPLNKDSSAIFLKTLIALMTLLAMLALAGSFALSEMSNRWSSGLENKLSIEIPVEDKSGNLLSHEQMQRLAQDIKAFLDKHPEVSSADIMPEEKIRDLVSPWLGDSPSLNSVPLPQIISVSFNKRAEIDTDALENKIHEFAPQARLDTHESWLKDILRFTGALKYTTLLITIIIGATTIIAVAGAVRARMAIYKEELELLHLMGAEDDYIAKQMQRHTLRLSLEGALIGAGVGIVLLFLINWGAGRMDLALLPDFKLSLLQQSTLLTLPFMVSLLNMLTARQTVLRILTQMP